MLKLLSLAVLALKILGPAPRRWSILLAISSRWRNLRSATSPHFWKWKLPAAMVCFRAMLGPALVLLALRRPSGLLLAGCVVCALISDIFDGVLARRWHVDTSRLRIGDTLADTIFYACVLIVILLRHPGALQQRWFLLATLIAAEIGQHAFAFARYGRNASYHSILAKCWGS